MSPAEQVLSLRRAGKHEEACALAVSLAVQSPGDTELQYEAACVHDFLGREAQAVPFYLTALRGGLSDEKLRRAYVGLSSTYRVLGQYAAAERTARDGLARFPDAVEMRAFLAMALHNLGQSKHAVEMLLPCWPRPPSTLGFNATATPFCSMHKDVPIAVERGWMTAPGW